MFAGPFCRSIATAGLIVAGLTASSVPSWAAQDPLHAFCWGVSTCSDNGSNTPVTQKEPDFGFSISPGPQTGDYWLDILVPDTNAHPASGPTIIENPNSLTPTDFVTSLFSSTPWTSGQLDKYLGISAQPTNPIGNYTPNAFAPGADGYFVYRADIGPSTLCNPADATNNVFTCAAGQSSPLFTIQSPGLAIGSYIVGFLKVGETTATKWIATANSGALFDTPEPATLLLFAAGVMGLFLLRRSESGLSRQTAKKSS